MGTRVRPVDGPPPVEGGGGTGPGRVVEPSVDGRGRGVDETERPVGCGAGWRDVPAPDAGAEVRGVRPVAGRADDGRPEVG
ncbi:hypothetical protein ASG53_07065 [Sanguibacter sp. Leaf3]|nr:hypothetical protein ASG53_07065 [Sanguibacter sp. Leaf3]